MCLKNILKSRCGEGYGGCVRPCPLRHAGHCIGGADLRYSSLNSSWTPCHRTDPGGGDRQSGRLWKPTNRGTGPAGNRPGSTTDFMGAAPGRIQLNQEVTVTVTYETDIGLFSGFGSFPITLRADATGNRRCIGSDQAARSCGIQRERFPVGNCHYPGTGHHLL